MADAGVTDAGVADAGVGESAVEGRGQGTKSYASRTLSHIFINYTRCGQCHFIIKTCPQSLLDYVIMIDTRI